MRQSERENTLREVGAPTLSKRKMPALQPGTAHVFTPVKKLSSESDVRAAIAAERKRMAPFLRTLAPKLPSFRERLELRTFDWRLKTEQDDADFSAVERGDGAWSSISVPHYGPPAGRATAFYRADFVLTDALLAPGSLWLRVEGADYIARVYVNGRCLGQHEGFFATFELEINGVARLGKNTLLIELQNDGVWQDVDGVPEGDKIYGATGPGWDEPGNGWHHCPAGMGLLGPVIVEARPRIFVEDVWARPLPDLASAELGIEVFNCDASSVATTIEFAVFGENHRARLSPWTALESPAPASRGRNRYLVTVALPEARLWSPATPWLLRTQVRLRDADGEIADTASRVFGLRTFRIDETTTPKGRLFLNNKPVRLRGANTMGYEQQSVMNGRLDELHSDMLLARLTNFNFLRLTQRPVQREVYEAADRLGLMLQTDLPLFGYLRRPQFCEAIRQASEMARHIRGHASAVLATFMNEPFPGHWRKFGHRHLNRPELESFFAAAAAAMHIEHPDIAIKPVDGDYDPPADGLPDCHIYSLWYQGHGLPFGKLHQGYFPGVKPDWCYGSGEYGAEGLDPVDLMRRRYPAEWLPDLDDPSAEAAWSANSISHAQTGRHQPLFFDRPTTLAAWVEASQRYQAEATRLQTEAYRRHDRLVSCAIHLFIDAWPAGWMKSIVDCERRPKPAWFACRDALAPWLPMLRTDRFAVTAGEVFPVEFWLANDTHEAPSGWTLHYQLERAGRVVASAATAARPLPCAPVFQGTLLLRAPAVTVREQVTLRLALCDENGQTVNDHALTFTVWPRPIATPLAVNLLSSGGAAEKLLEELGVSTSAGASVLLADTWPEDAPTRRSLLARVAAGATLVLTELQPGTYAFPGEGLERWVNLEIKPCGFTPLDFVSRATGHALVAGFEADDFRYWHDPAAGRITPLLPTTFQAPGWTPILLSGEAGWGAPPHPAFAAAERSHGKGRIIVSLVSLAGRTSTNPAAERFARRLLAPVSPS
jgi:hypothetical protein